MEGWKLIKNEECLFCETIILIDMKMVRGLVMLTTIIFEVWLVLGLFRLVKLLMIYDDRIEWDHVLVATIFV